MTNYLELGQIVNTFGIKGMVKVNPFTDDVNQFKNFKSIYVKSKNIIKEYQIDEVKFHKQMVLIKFKGIDNPDDANLLRNSYLVVDRKDVEKLAQDTYYIVDMIGLQVYTEEGSLLGTLEDIYNTGSNDIYVVKTEKGKEILLPAIADVIKKIDMENKMIIIHLMEGLI